MAMVRGPAAGLVLVDALMASGVLGDHHRVVSVRAHLLERSGDMVRAAEEFARAAGLAANVAERHYLLKQVARLQS
jgi:predicted RNA polymerase sigma factor